MLRRLVSYGLAVVATTSVLLAGSAQAHHLTRDPWWDGFQEPASTTTTTSTTAPPATSTTVPTTTTSTTTPTSCTGIDVRPGDDLQAAFNARAEGTTFCIRAGVHRISQILLPRNHQKLIGEPGAVISGAKPVTNWVQDGTRWVATGQTQESAPYGSCYYGTACSYNEWMYIDDTFMTRVMTLAEVGPGKFFFDYPGDRIYIGTDPTGHKMEASVSPGGIGGLGSITGLVVKGLVFEKMANRHGWGALRNGTGWTIDNNVIQLNHGTGLDHGTKALVTNNKILWNGDTGVGCYLCDGVLFANNEVSHSQHLWFRNSGDGSKWTGATNLTIRDNYFHDNIGTAIWPDGGNLNVLIEGNRIINNGGHGIHYEVSCAATIRNNLIEGNENGISIVASQNVDVYGNTIRGNTGSAGDKGGIIVWHQERRSNPGSGILCPWTLKNVTIHDNSITMTKGFTGLLKYNVSDGDTVFSDGRVRFYDNRFWVSNLATGRFWRWGNTSRTKLEWQGFGNDLSGTFNLL